MRRCSRCKLYKSNDEFSRNKSSRTGFQHECRACRKIITQGYGRGTYKLPQRQDLLRRFWRYGITACDFTKMRIAQNDRCAVCKEVPKKFLVIDHDHQTGKVRGLLCERCNKGLGHFKDSVELMRSAISYVSAA